MTEPIELLKIGIAMASEISIPLEKAIELCRVHRDKHGVRMFSQCWGCVRFSKGVPEKMCFYKPPNNDGCKIVNKEFEASNPETSKENSFTLRLSRFSTKSM